jgi:hypothetical protein
MSIGRRFRVDEPCVRHDGNAQRQHRACHERSPGARERRRDVVDRQRGERGDQAHHRDGSAVASQGIRGQQQGWEAWRVDGVNLAVLSSRAVIGTERAAKKRPVVATRVVVRDLEVVIHKEAVRNHEIVRLVALGSDSRRGCEAARQIDDQTEAEDRGTRRRDSHPPERPANWRCERPDDLDDRRDRDRPAQGAGEEQDERRPVGNPGQKGHGPEPQHQKRRECVREPTERRPISRASAKRKRDRGDRDDTTSDRGPQPPE